MDFSFERSTLDNFNGEQFWIGEMFQNNCFRQVLVASGSAWDDVSPRYATLESNFSRKIESRQAQRASHASNSSHALSPACLECGEDFDGSQLSIFEDFFVVQMRCLRHFSIAQLGLRAALMRCCPIAPLHYCRARGCDMY